MRIEQYITIGYIIISLLFFTGVTLTYKNSEGIISAGKEIANSNRVLFQLESLKREIISIQSYTRAYIITSNPEFSAITTTTIDSAYSHVEVLRRLLAGNQLQLAQVDSMLAIGNQATKGNRYIRNLVKEGKKEEAVKFVETGAVVTLTHQLETIADKMKAREEASITLTEQGLKENQSEFFIQLIIRATLIPIILLGIYFLITYNLRNLRKTQTRLNETARLLSGLIENAPVTVTVRDTEGNIILANDDLLKSFGLTAEQVKGKKVSDFLPAADAERIKQHDLQVINYNTKLEVENTVTVNGIKQTIFSVAFPTHDENGKVNYICNIGINISERKFQEESILRLNRQLEEKISDLKEANKEMEIFTYSVAHDMRTPLRAISAFSSLLQREHADELSGEAKRFLGILDDNARNMGKLIDSLLQYATIGQTKLSYDETNITTLAAKVVEELKVADPTIKTNITLGNPKTIPCDRVMIKLVLQNLLGNAFKYSSRVVSPQIQFDSYQRNGEMVFYVKDNGAGFDMKYSDKLFSPFQRLHDDEGFEGTGIGLAIVQRIIQKHGGKVWAEGKVNQGATFYFSLPVKSEKDYDQN